MHRKGPEKRGLTSEESQPQPIDAITTSSRAVKGKNARPRTTTSQEPELNQDEVAELQESKEEGKDRILEMSEQEIMEALDLLITEGEDLLKRFPDNITTAEMRDWILKVEGTFGMGIGNQTYIHAYGGGGLEDYIMSKYFYPARDEGLARAHPHGRGYHPDKTLWYETGGAWSKYDYRERYEEGSLSKLVMDKQEEILDIHREKWGFSSSWPNHKDPRTEKALLEESFVNAMSQVVDSSKLLQIVTEAYKKVDEMEESQRKERDKKEAEKEIQQAEQEMDQQLEEMPDTPEASQE